MHRSACLGARRRSESIHSWSWTAPCAAADEVDVLDRMRGPVFERARTPEGFATVCLDTESGTVVWPGGADLAPDVLYERVRTGSWPAITA
jgi:hypothetical protein